MKTQIDNVYILGLGALGSIYGALLYDLDPRCVKVIANATRGAALNRNGVKVNGKYYSFEYIDPADQSQPVADLVIIAVKYPQLEQAILDVKNFIGKETVVISLLNGISSEEIIGNAIGMEHMLYAYGIGMDAQKSTNGINYTNMGKLVFGEKENRELSDRVKLIKELFEKAKIPFEIPPNMYRALWAKFMMNTGINQVSAILRAPYGEFQKNKGVRELMFTAAGEVARISNYLGIDLDQSDVDAFYNIVKTLNPAAKTSMLQDVEAKRKTEVELFSGTVIALSKKYNIPTPVNETLYKIIKAMEEMC